ncbi:hypothetical protein AB0M39_28285 [Streptomyces sp. NPDC051907]|uniref:hypothetical protein n=1 Tax=Streptomyces sp. NPDC051907 TaxID=3155284 RepID=UPI003439A69A
MGRTGTTRRRALVVSGAAAAAVLTGCSSEPADGGRTQDAAADPARAQAARAAQKRRLAAASGALRDRYDAVIAQHPTLAGQLKDLRAAAAEHAEALGGRRPASRPGVPAEAGAALKELAAAERGASAAYTAALMDAEPELARLYASVAAAGAAHAYLLTKGPGR